MTTTAEKQAQREAMRQLAHAPRRNRGKGSQMAATDRTGNAQTVPGSDELAEGVDCDSQNDETFADHKAKTEAKRAPKFDKSNMVPPDAPVENKRTKARLKR